MHIVIYFVQNGWMSHHYVQNKLIFLIECRYYGQKELNLLLCAEEANILNEVLICAAQSIILKRVPVVCTEAIITNIIILVDNELILCAEFLFLFIMTSFFEYNIHSGPVCVCMCVCCTCTVHPMSGYVHLYIRYVRFQKEAETGRQVETRDPQVCLSLSLSLFLHTSVSVGPLGMTEEDRGSLDSL